MRFRFTKSVAVFLITNLLVLIGVLATRKTAAVVTSPAPVAQSAAARSPEPSEPQARPTSAYRPGSDVPLLAPTQTRRWVSDRVHAWLPTNHERRWEKIGWTVGIQNALNRARALNRPVLLFSYAGCIEGRL